MKVGTGVPLVPGAFSLGLSDVVTVSGSFSAVSCNARFVGADGHSELESSSDGSIPVRLTFSPSQRMWGLSAPDVQVSASLSTSGKYTFQSSLPGGEYDVYVEPFQVADAAALDAKACPLIPQLFRAQDLTRSTSLKLALPTPKHIDIKLRFPEGTQDLDGWNADMLEPVSGRVVSTRSKLELPTRSDGKLVYGFGIDYVPVWGDDIAITHGELLRLTPPERVDAPSLFFWREGLEWAAQGSGSIDNLGAFPAPVSFSGQVSDASSGSGVRASVTCAASEVTGVAAGVFSSFIRTTQTDAQGRFKLDLLPGVYRVVATPDSPVDASQRPFAISTTSLTVLGSPAVQAGATLQVQPALNLQGSVFAPNGVAARGATATVEVSSAPATTSVFERAIGQLPTVPRATQGLVGTDGTFGLFAEPGVYDFSVRPPASSGFAWLVMPGFEPAPASQRELDASLPELRLPSALPLDLFVRILERTEADSNEALRGASVRVYALLDSTGTATTDAKAAVSAVRIADARLDSAGHTSLVLPAQLDCPPDGFQDTAQGQQP
ncbi:MAG: carboxypeptidase-like regulatory domain-containing protein [Polyangiaceae bacterium]